MEFSRQEYRSGVPFPSPGDLLHRGIEPGSPGMQADSLPSEPPGKPPGHKRPSNMYEMFTGKANVIEFLSMSY